MILPIGLRAVTPEWMMILKIIAGRQKDFDDVVFWLSQPQLADRPTIKQKMIEVGGEDAWLIRLPSFR